ncbi:hypothetical protein FNF29_02527 [Cafeteria roenbergensis]|uniref:AP2/ERF domain-containing protein n=1 Tax=Cafeteria roenbergensis TaxID=33653 RepID=A0A5A8CP81_CAFRO|nr:hypothetical protein FNF29_02527 [Cafeteria roenbergensis]|eukprot:KAA0154307.1 hypothetical protein FNF29_02527 [Cafeteria roenbergensis]
MKSALAHGAASLREATEAMRLALRASAPAQLELGTRARQIASSVGEGAGLVAVGIAASERAFSRRTGMSEWVLRVIVAAIVMGVGSLAVTFADTIKAFMGAQASKAVAGVLRDEDIRNSASLTVSELAERLLADDELRTASAAFLQGLMAAPETRAALLDLLVWALQEESTRQQLVALLSHEATLRATRDLLIWAFSDPATRRQMEQLASWLLADESFQLVGVRALLGVLNSTLDDKPLRDHAAEALSSVVADTSLQQRTGEALWNAVAWSVTPSILRSPDGKPEAAVPDAAALAPAPPADAAQTVDGAQAGPQSKQVLRACSRSRLAQNCCQFTQHSQLRSQLVAPSAGMAAATARLAPSVESCGTADDAMSTAKVTPRPSADMREGGNTSTTSTEPPLPWADLGAGVSAACAVVIRSRDGGQRIVPEAQPKRARSVDGEGADDADPPEEPEDASGGRTPTGSRASSRARTGEYITSRFRGVYGRSSAKANGVRWAAHASDGKRKVHLGYFNTEEDAAKAYDEAVRRFKGPNAITNFA